MSELTPDQIARLIRLLEPHVAHSSDRSAWVNVLFASAPNKPQVDYTGTPFVFASNFIAVLAAHRTLDGEPALVALLEALSERVGSDHQAEIADLLSQLAAPPPMTSTVVPQSVPSGELPRLKDVIERAEALLDAEKYRELIDELTPMRQQMAGRAWDALDALIAKAAEGQERLLALAELDDIALILQGKWTQEGGRKMLREWRAAHPSIPLPPDFPLIYFAGTLTGHTSSVTATAFSPDGRTIVSASVDKTLRLWDAASGALLRTLTGHTSSVTAAAFSPDGRTIVSASVDKTLRLWDVASGAPPRTLTGHTSAVNDAAFSPDGWTIVSASTDQTLRLWDAANGAPLRTLTRYNSAFTAAAFSPDGRSSARRMKICCVCGMPRAACRSRL